MKLIVQPFNVIDTNYKNSAIWLYNYDIKNIYKIDNLMEEKLNKNVVKF